MVFWCYWIRRLINTLLELAAGMPERANMMADKFESLNFDALQAVIDGMREVSRSQGMDVEIRPQDIEIHGAGGSRSSDGKEEEFEEIMYKESTEESRNHFSAV